MTHPALDAARLAELQELDPDSTAYLDRAIGNFEVNSVAAVAEIRAHVVAGDLAAARATAHKIAGSALNLGARRAGEAARAVELALDDAVLPAGLDGLVAVADDALHEARLLLLAYRSSSGPSGHQA